MKKLQFSILPILVLASCATTNDAPARIDNALLSELAPSSLVEVTEARATKDSAEDALAAADRETRWAEEQVDLARSGLKVARAELDESKLAMVVAERSGTVSQLDSAKLEHEYFSASADMARELLALRKREYEHAMLKRKVALEEFRLKTAQVEYQKAMAVQALDRVAAKQVPVKDYQKQVRFHETEVELARVRLAAMAQELEDARQAYESVRSKVDALKNS